MEEKNTNEQHGTQPTDTQTPVDTSTNPATHEVAAGPESHTDVNTAGMNAATTPASESTTPWVFIISVVAVIVLLAGGVWWLSQGQGATDLGNNGTTATTAPTFSADEYPEVIARVNGQDITIDRFIQGLEQAAQQVAQQGANPNDDATRTQMEEQTATALVNTELLVQAAQAANITADEAAIDAEINQIITQFGSEEVFAQELEAAGLTMDELRADFEEQLSIDAFIRQTPEWDSVSVESGEAQAFYDDIASQNQGEELPPFAEVEAAIEEQLLGNKQQEVTQTILDRLRAEAEIEVLI